MGTQYSSLCHPGDTCLNCSKRLIQTLLPPHTHRHNEDFCCSCLSGCSPKCPSLPRPGMLIWNCQGCPYPTKTHHADVELSGPSGKVGNLVVTHMIPEGGVGQNVEIENVNTRVSFENLQKQRNFDVRIHEGTCENLGEKIHSVRCSNCQNSLAVKIMGSQKKLHIKGDGSEGDLIGKVVLFYDRQ